MTRDAQRGGIIVAVSLSMLGIGLVVGLAMETFRLLSTHLQMQNVAEYASEVVLAEVLAGSINQAQVAARVSAVANGNRFLAQTNSGGNGNGLTASAVIDSGDFCFNNLGCTAGIKVLTGCFNPNTRQLTCATSPACVAPQVGGAYVRIATFSKRRVVMVVGKIFGVNEINISATGFSYLSGSLFMTSPASSTITYASCG